MTVFSPGSRWRRHFGPAVCAGAVIVYIVISPLLLRGPLWLPLWLVPGLIAIGAAVAAFLLPRRQIRHHAGELQRTTAETQRLQAELRDLETLCVTRWTALDGLVRQQLPAILHGEPTPPLPDLARDEVSAGLLAEAVKQLERLHEDQQATSNAMQAAVVALGRSVQASAHRLQEEAARMVQRHQADADVLESGMRVDHAAAQQARRAQSLAVVCGEWPGQQWHEPLPLADVVRGAAGRIVAYQRVEVSGDPGVAVAAQVVEPLIHLVAELLANATQSSPPNTQVLVTLRHVQRGAVIEIDDCGVGVDENRLQQLRETASGHRQVGLAELGVIPQTGLPVVGAYARRHGFRVDLTESVYGGLRAIVLVPVELTDILASPGLPAAATELQARAAGGHTGSTIELADPASEPAPSLDEPKLPRRRSRRGEARRAAVEHRQQDTDVTVQTPEQAGDWMAAFLATGTGSGRSEDAGGKAPTDATDTGEEL